MMNFSKENVGKDIKINFDEEIVFGKDEAYIGYPATLYPVVFPTVNFNLYNTFKLVKIADRMRKANGFAPMFDDSGAYTYDGWYNFYIGINGFSDTKLDSYIIFTVDSETQSDDGEVYYIDLSEEERSIIYAELDKQCENNIGKRCSQILDEAKKEIDNV